MEVAGIAVEAVAWLLRRRWLALLRLLSLVDVVPVVVLALAAVPGGGSSVITIALRDISTGGGRRGGVNIFLIVQVRPRLLPTRCRIQGTGGSTGGGTARARRRGPGRHRITWINSLCVFFTDAHAPTSLGSTLSDPNESVHLPLKYHHPVLNLFPSLGTTIENCRPKLL